MGVDLTVLYTCVDQAVKVFYEFRKKWISSFMDDKVLMVWNGLMIFVFVRGVFVFGEICYVEIVKCVVNVVFV